MTWKEHLQISKRAIRFSFQLDHKYAICVILNAFLSAVIGYIPIYFSAKVIDALYQHDPLSIMILYVALTVGLVFLINFINTYISAKKNTAAYNMYRNELWMFSEKAMKMAYESIEDSEVTRLRYRIQKESQTGFNCYYLYHTLEHGIGNLTKIVASSGLTASFFGLPSVPVYMKLLMLAGLIVTLVVSMFSTSKINELDHHFWDISANMNVLSQQFSDYIENYSAGKDIRMYGMKDHLADESLKLDADYYNLAIQNSYKQALWSIPSSILLYGFEFGVYAILIFAALDGSITVGAVAKYVSCIMLLIGAITDMVKTVQEALDNQQYLKRYFSYLDIPNHMYQGTLTVEKRDDNEYFVEFHNVSFRYPNTDQYALRNVNFRFKIGEKLAIVGRNGSGKTTFIKLLCRLYDPTEGEILLNGVDIRKYDYNEYLSIFSVVFQDFKLFSFGLGQNVAAGVAYDPERVTSCLAKAGFGDRLQDMPEGLNTCLHKDFEKTGVEISGGEAQKIALARALYKNAPFIILDEPTAALDPIAEYEVYSKFDEIVGEKTAIYISHRLSSCRFCDTIAVFDQGQIVQKGSHEQLVSDETGKYYELWHAQAQYYTVS